MTDKLNIPIGELNLSARSRKSLQRLHLTFLKDVAFVTKEELLATKNFGEVSLWEIQRKLAEYGLSLAEAKKTL